LWGRLLPSTPTSSPTNETARSYTGSTDSIIDHTSQHREKVFRGFSAKYGCACLVWHELHPARHDAFIRERQIKKWNRVWKLKLIERSNPGWRDLFDDLF